MARGGIGGGDGEGRELGLRGGGDGVGGRVRGRTEGGVAMAPPVGVTGWIVSVLLGGIVWTRAWGKRGGLLHGHAAGGMMRWWPVEIIIALEDHRERQMALFIDSSEGKNLSTCLIHTRVSSTHTPSLTHAHTLCMHTQRRYHSTFLYILYSNYFVLSPPPPQQQRRSTAFICHHSI